MSGVGDGQPYRPTSQTNPPKELNDVSLISYAFTLNSCHSKNVAGFQVKYFQLLLRRLQVSPTAISCNLLTFCLLCGHGPAFSVTPIQMPSLQRFGFLLSKKKRNATS